MRVGDANLDYLSQLADTAGRLARQLEQTGVQGSADDSATPADRPMQGPHPLPRPDDLTAFLEDAAREMREAAERTVPPTPPPPEPKVDPKKAARQKRKLARKAWYASWRTLRYVISSSVFISLVWALTITYISTAKPVFESKWRINLPGDSINTGLKLENVGEAKASSNSPFQSRNIDPRETYRAISRSSAVKLDAAERAGETYDTYDRPKMKVIPQTAILEFSARGSSPEHAKRRAFAFIGAFEARVDALREDNTERRESPTIEMVDSLGDRLTEIRQRSLEQQQEGHLVTASQFDAFAQRAAILRGTREGILIELQEAEARFKWLSAALGVQPSAAAAELTLRGDRVFQEHARAAAEADTKLDDLRGTWGEKHPEVVTWRNRLSNHRKAAAARALSITGESPDVFSALTDPNGASERAELFSSIISLAATMEGKKAQLRAVEAAEEALKKDLTVMSQDAAMLSDLERERAVAEAVFTSSVARLDLSRSDPYASYPFFQLIDGPGTPSKPVLPNKPVAVGGAAAATLFILLAHGVAWNRSRLRLRRKSSSGRWGSPTSTTRQARSLS